VVCGLLAIACLTLPPARAENAPEPLSDGDARRLFLDYINDPKNLIRACVFRGGIQIDEMRVRGEFVLARIRYRIECRQEEIEVPSLTRVLQEEFVYRRIGTGWILLGRASELHPGLLESGGGAWSTEFRSAPDPEDQDRKTLAEQVLAWAVLDRRPLGVEEAFPRREALGEGNPVLVSREGGLGSVDRLDLENREVILLPEETLLRRAGLSEELAWVRFGEIEVRRGSARVEASVISAILPPPAPGRPASRAVVRLVADFYRGVKGWLLTRHRFEEPQAP
jgi:hypothetical protein